MFFGKCCLVGVVCCRWCSWSSFGVARRGWLVWCANYSNFILPKFATVTQHGERGWRTYVPINSNPFITHPTHLWLYHTIGGLRPEQQCGFFYVSQESEQWKSCETGPTVFCPYSRRQDCLTICRGLPSVGPAGVWTRDLPLDRPALIQLS